MCAIIRLCPSGQIILMGSYSKVIRNTEVFNNGVGAMLSSRIEKEKIVYGI